MPRRLGTVSLREVGTSGECCGSVNQGGILQSNGAS
jgi:hypothetical protein